ncbi:MAG: CpaF family protein [Myxococcales bacterium]|nr:CpaF family protein [Myxococcales bacterium]
MSLSQRLKQSETARTPTVGPPGSSSAIPTAADLESYYDLKIALHERIVDKLDLETINRLSPGQLREEIATLLGQMVTDGNVPLNRREREQMVQELLDEILGLGPLEALIHEASISDVLVNTYSTIYVERFGKLELTNLRFRDNEHLLQTINRIVARVGRRIDETSPMVDARLPDGSRVNAIIPPLAVDGPILSIRRFGGKPLRMADLLIFESCTEPMTKFIEGAVKARLNVLISGGTGSGKTTLLNAMSSYIPSNERIITIEDAAELQLQQPHVVRLETRPSNVEGRGEILARDLVRNSLRMRPDRIIVGEIRSTEVLDMLQAMNTGHEGSMATIHANAPRDALNRMVAMIGMSGITMSESVTSQTISRALDLIVQLNRGSDGKRRITSITEVTGAEGTVIQLQEIFTFVQRGLGDDGKVLGEFAATGARPRCMERLERAGATLDATTFRPQPRR